jgi:hypothetical protein
MFCHNSPVHEGTSVIPVSHPEGCVNMVVRTNSLPVSVVPGFGAGVVTGVEIDVATVGPTIKVEEVDDAELDLVEPEGKTPIVLS